MRQIFNIVICLQMDGEGLLNEELPNCWECPKCYQEDSSEKTQVRELSPILHCEKEGSIKLRITFAFASLFARLFFILFCLLSFFFLWLIIFLLSFKFCGFFYYWILLGVLGVCKFLRFFYTLGPLKKRSHSWAVWGGKWGELGLLMRNETWGEAVTRVSW